MECALLVVDAGKDKAVGLVLCKLLCRPASSSQVFGGSSPAAVKRSML